VPAEAIVCGAGTAGLAAAASLRRAGIEATVLERSDQVGASWRSRYSALRLNTPGWMSTQPGLRAKIRRYGEFPSRDKWIEYLEEYAAHHALDIRFGTEVRRIDRGDGIWRVETGAEAFEAQAVVVATGFDHDPHMPGGLAVRGVLLAGGESGDRDPVEVIDRGALLRGAGAQLREVDPEALDSLKLGEGLPESHLSGDPDQQALQLEHSAQRGIPAKPPVRLQARELLRHPGAGRLDATLREAEPIDDQLEGGAVLFDFHQDPFQRGAEVSPAVARA
jgi:glycine/D-amino acid oxidase-like deaminating enzyme